MQIPQLLFLKLSNDIHLEADLPSFGSKPDPPGGWRAPAPLSAVLSY